MLLGAGDSRQGILELAHPGAEGPPDLRQPLSAEQQQRHEQEEQDLGWADIAHERKVAANQ